MYLRIASVKLLFCTAFLLCGISSCTMIQDDLETCPSGVWVKLEVTMDVAYGGKYSPQRFADDLDNITIWVFDENGVFIDKFRENGAVLKQNDNMVNLPIAPGTYKMVVWTGTESVMFDVSGMTPGVSVLDDLKVRVVRNGNHMRDGKLPSLWHGRINNAVVKKYEYTHLSVELTKDTNTIIAVLQDTSGNNLNGQDYSFEIIADNGYLNYDNQLLPDVDISYEAYLVETAPVGAMTTLSVARAELNTLRLMADRATRLVVTHNASGVAILDINLTEYLLLTREYYTGSNGVVMSPQAYLDYEDLYRIVFFLAPTGNPANPYIITIIKINDWIIRLNNADL